MILHFFEGLKRFQLFDVKIPCFILLPFEIIILTDDFITDIKAREMNIFSKSYKRLSLQRKQSIIVSPSKLENSTYLDFKKSNLFGHDTNRNSISMVNHALQMHSMKKKA